MWSTVVSTHVEKKLQTVTSEMIEVQKTIIEAKQQIDEEREKDKRKNNIVIYRMEESKAAGPDARKRDDLKFCLDLVQEVLEVDCGSGDIVNMYRLGKQEDNYCCLVLVNLGARRSRMQ